VSSRGDGRGEKI